MRFSRLLLAAVLLLTVFAIRPLAEASPPDPTWVAGLYDNADFDDVILAITSTAAVVDADLGDCAVPTLVVVGRTGDLVPAIAPALADLAHQPRSPPSH